ncbi:MAG: cysteine desulfurase [Cyclobacteriaceae bacterium]
MVETKTINVDEIRSQFPVLQEQVNGKPLVYFDNAATTQKPLSVLKALEEYYHHKNSNIHRGVHALAEKATTAFEATRETARAFINSSEVDEIIFTKGTTEGLNLVASSYGRKFLNEGDEVIISTMEHHSNIVPWQMICEEKGAKLKVIPINQNGEIIFEEYEKLLTDRTKIVSTVYASNALGTINPVKKIIDKAHEFGAITVLDGAQATAHLPIDVQALDVDFYALSAHKMYGPTGVGVLYGKRKLLEEMPPYQGGGEMIKDVSFEKTTFNDIPYKFEAGTPNIADVVGFKYAMDFVNDIGKEAMAFHEMEVHNYAMKKMGQIPGFKGVGTAKNKVSVLSFLIEGIHPFDIGQMLDSRGVAVRTGHHCTQPLMDWFGIEGTVRASFSVYNTKKEVDVMAEGLQRIVKFMKP